MMRKFTFFLLLILTTVYAWADKKATLTAEAPDVVVSGDQFRLTFTVNTQKVKDFRAPSITKGFDVLMYRAVLSRVVRKLLMARYLQAVLLRILIY